MQMHKTRRFLPPLPEYEPGGYDLHHAKLRLVAFPRDNLKITYEFEKHTQPIIAAMSKAAGRPLPLRDGYVVVPVHELQVTHIQDKFPDAEIFPDEFSLPIFGQLSVR